MTFFEKILSSTPHTNVAVNDSMADANESRGLFWQCLITEGRDFHK